MECLRDLGVDAKLNRPNDIFLGDKKLAGVLIDSRVVDGVSYIAAGVGINYSFGSDSPIEDIATDIVSNYGNLFTKDDLASQVWKKIACCLDTYFRLGFDAFSGKIEHLT